MNWARGGLDAFVVGGLSQAVAWERCSRRCSRGLFGTLCKRIPARCALSATLKKAVRGGRGGRDTDTAGAPVAAARTDTRERSARPQQLRLLLKASARQ